ncbi:MAG: RNA-binding cell elongation regulator Jag/EloR [Clostridia bacterium]|jgi:spoIIIJ-associated protein|nr:RNA-binding cell elongation regulator Jag/EloR [Spirochaetia bacterium]
MEYEFEGRTEEEAIELAARELGLARDEFDVEILESQRGGFLKKGKTRIKVHTRSLAGNATGNYPGQERYGSPGGAGSGHQSTAGMNGNGNGGSNRAAGVGPKGAGPADDVEEKLLEFVRTVVEHMGYNCKTSILFREELKLGIRIESSSAAILIGKKGKNLDAIQLLANVYAGKLGREDLRVIIDSENYRIRREESIVRMAYETAERVRQSRNSVLLEPMNPFERRIVHTTLNDIVDIETKSEGEGLYKQVRVLLKGRSR